MSVVRLLLLEDNDDDALLLQASLDRHAPGEFALVRAGRLAEALARIAAEPFDAALSDLDLPDSHGLATVRALAERNPALPLVVLTGLNDRTLGREAIRNGAQDYLVKSESGQAMIAHTLRYAIERKRLEAGLRTAKETLERRVAGRTAELERTIAALARQKDLYQVLSQTNTTIVRCSNREELFSSVCRIAVEHGHFLFAWIGLIDKDDQRLQPTARYGSDAGYIDQLDFAGNGSGAPRRGLTGRTLASGVHVISNDFLNDPAMAPWHDLGRRAGVRAAAKFPIRQGGAVVGAINFYSDEAGYFTGDLIATLEETATDISFALDNLEREEDLRRLNRALAAINACNEALIRSSDETQLLDEICALLVTQGGFSRAYVAEFSRESQSYQTLAQAGTDDGYVAAVIASIDRSAERGAPFADTIRRTGEPLVCNDIATDPAFPRWREEALKRGFASCAFLPLAANGMTFGMLSIYADKSGAFDDQEVDLLVRLASDLAYGIVARRTRAERDQALQERQSQQDRLRKSLEESVEVVAATVEARDPYTAGHQQRVADLAAAIAQMLGLGEEQIAGIRLGAIVHDLGKIHIPAEILSKPGRLSKIEFELIKSHPQSGYDIVKGIEFPWPIAQIVLQHHERLDGSGYPQGLKGDAIILEARILAVADVVEAMSSHRPYRPGLGIDRAIEEIRAGRGNRYEPAVVDACVTLFTEKRYELPR